MMDKSFLSMLLGSIWEMDLDNMRLITRKKKKLIRLRLESLEYWKKVIG